MADSVDNDMEKLMDSFEMMESLLENFTKTYMNTLITLNMEREKKNDYCKNRLFLNKYNDFLLQATVTY